MTETLSLVSEQARNVARLIVHLLCPHKALGSVLSALETRCGDRSYKPSIQEMGAEEFVILRCPGVAGDSDALRRHSPLVSHTYLTIAVEMGI